MNDARMRAMFRRVLWLSAALPILGTACGGGLAEEESSDGGTEKDAPLDRMKDAPPDHPIVDAGCYETGPLPEPDPCTTYLPLPCEIPLDAGALDPDTCLALCGAQPPMACFVVAELAAVECITCAVGRRPEGFVPSEIRADSVLGGYFARVAELEEASIGAFRRLRDELAHHGAPRRLVNRAARSARDEIRHTRMTRALARRYGGSPRPPSDARAALTPVGVRSLEAIALENVVEGCVRETFGALTATLQSERAQDPGVAAVMKRVARDETAHAALAWSIAQWLRGRLDAEGRARIDAATQRAFDGLDRELRDEPPEELVQTAGVPRAADARRLLAALRAESIRA
jgi:hypothetical protein